MKAILTGLLLCAGLFTHAQVNKAPAYPLITHSPYFSIWSATDQLTGSTTSHWTGASHSMIGLITVDGINYRFLGRSPEQFKTILPTSEESAYPISYTETKPGDEWTKPGFDDRNWKTGKAPVGNFQGTDNTLWKSHDIWIRRTFKVTDIDNINRLLLRFTHDDGAEIFLNGESLYHKVGPASYRMLDIDKSRIKPGDNILAMHVENTGGGARADAGLLDQKKVADSTSIRNARQISVQVNATQTIYRFVCGKIDLDVTFTSPLLMNDIQLMARPVSYVNYKVVANDARQHEVKVFFSASANIAVNHPSQSINAKKYNAAGLSILKAGTIAQPILKKKGDDLRIDWGYFYVAAPLSGGVVQFITPEKDAVTAYQNGKLNTSATTGNGLSLNTVIPFAKVGKVPQSRFIALGYDELFAIEYFHVQLRPYWNTDGKNNMDKQMSLAYRSYQEVISKCEAFDKKLYADALAAGGDEYAKLCILAYRQSISAHQLVKSPKGELLFLSKENFSNGSINTVDVTYPSSPLFLLYNPNLLKGMLNGIFEYSESGVWKKNFPAHDLGKYPIANGQLYGEDMPVEEAGNMIIMMDAIAQVEKNSSYAKAHWKTLSVWAAYLLEAGLDPQNQLCTDDFAGHLARNANLSVKAIVAIGCYADLARQLGYTDVANQYQEKAKGMVQKWMKLAEAGDHYSLVFEQPETWSQKYNLVWDKVLDLKLFPQEVYNREISFYLKKQNKYGLPLDSRKNYTKSDWITWTATMTDSSADFQAFIAPVYRFATETPSRVPLSDWHETETGKMTGFQARSVVGGYYIKMLAERLNKTK